MRVNNPPRALGVKKRPRWEGYPVVYPNVGPADRWALRSLTDGLKKNLICRDNGGEEGIRTLDTGLPRITV
jgi:hypothetical protein